ncbi:MAG: nuclear transport factor 2 family protein [Bacteroidota bacterium]
MHANHKALVRRFYRDLIGAGDTGLAERLIAEDYIQHNPQVPTGRAGVLAAIAFLQKMPRKVPTEDPIKRMIADGPLVAVHLNVSFADTHQVVMDLFRIENEQLVEHWDGIQAFREAEIPQLMSGPQEVQDLERTETNRALIKAKALAEASNDPDLETHRIVAEGNFVMTQSSLAGDTPKVRYDWYCLDQGEITHHWQVEQVIPEQMAHGNGMI